MINANASGAEAALPFSLIDSSTGLGIAGHSWTDAGDGTTVELKVRLPGGAYANAVIARIEEVGVAATPSAGEYEYQMTAGETATPGKVYYYTNVAGADSTPRWEDILASAGGAGGNSGGSASTIARLMTGELDALKRRMLIRVFLTDGSAAPAETTFSADGETLVDLGDGRFTGPDGTLTNATRVLSVADTVFTTDAATNICTAVAHGLETGDGPVKNSNSGGAAPGGLIVGANHYVIWLSDDTFKLADSRAHALAGTAIDITTNGTGVQTLEQGDGCGRVIDGAWLYEFSADELSLGGAYRAVRLLKDGVTSEAWAVAVTHDPTTEGSMNAIAEGSYTYGDLHRLIASMNAGRVLNFLTGVLEFKDIATGAITRWTLNTNPTGRISVLPGTLGPT